MVDVPPSVCLIEIKEDYWALAEVCILLSAFVDVILVLW